MGRPFPLGARNRIPINTLRRFLPQRQLTVSPLRGILRDATVLLTLFVVILLLQWASGAYSAAFGAESDEASHYVTGVMVRDYLARGFPGNPITFAKDFYLHYPRVAFGLWPPLFHILSGIWMLAFGTTRISIMLMLAAMTCAWAFVFYRIVCRPFGTIGAAIMAFLLVLLPITQKATSAVMLDIPMAIMMLLAMASYARYLERERTADAFMFGLWAALAILVKYNALTLALLPPLCVVITGRYYLCRTKSFWLPAAVVAVVAGPWYFIMRHLVFYAADPGDAAPTIGSVVVANAKGLLFVAGPVVFVLAVIGGALVCTKIGRSRYVANPNEWSLGVVSIATIMGSLIFYGVIYPIYDPRYLLPAAPPLILLARQSIRYMYAIGSNRPPFAVAALFVVIAAHLTMTFMVPAKRTGAYVTVAKEVIASGLPNNGAVLISADGIGEGMLTAEFAMHDHRADHYVVRANKVLASQTLMGDKYQVRYHTAEEMMAVLDSIPIAIVVIQQCSGPKCEHEKILTQAAARYPERWRLASIIPSEVGSPVRIYQIGGNESKPVRSLRIEMTNTLGTTIE